MSKRGTWTDREWEAYKSTLPPEPDKRFESRYWRKKRLHLALVPEPVAQPSLVEVVPGEPDPRALQRELREVDVQYHRRTWCRLYDSCLDAAWKAQWASFTCEECHVEDEYSDEEKRVMSVRVFAAHEEPQDALPKKRRG